MTRTIFRLALVAIACLLSVDAARSADAPATVSWPEPTQSARPWTRWWWHGSAVDHQNLSRLLEEYHRVGLGGVEITCIYGVQGNQDRNLSYRSSEWVDAVQHTISEAQRLGMGVDLPAGSGWRMGGPNITPDLANSAVVLGSERVQGPAKVELPFKKATPQAALAKSDDGRTMDLTDNLVNGKLVWQAPAGQWTVYTAGYRWSGDKVKRPGPGGAGLNINPYWRRSVDAFLSDFGSTLDELPGVRAQFHDSFEYEGDWQPEFFAEFEQRRGYRLQDHLDCFAGAGDPDLAARVKCDYRETLSDLVRDALVEPWIEWSHQHGMLARNQSHGSPSNWLDLYAACDIPETESFGRLHGGDANLLMLKFASSGANVAGRKLTSSETATWLNEHFQVTLAEVKQLIDRQILSGVNHVFYHGTAYSPADAAWPGWLFYASTQMNPQNPLWRDAPKLNLYVTRCQSLLQAAAPDNDVLLYWPLHDFWHDPKGMRKDIRVHNLEGWFKRKPLGNAAELLHREGYPFDYVSDRLLADCTAGEHGGVVAPGGEYQAVVVPRTEHMPIATIEKLAELAAAGCRVLVVGDAPRSIAGLKGAASQSEWAPLRERFADAARTLREEALVDADLSAMLQQAQLRREAWAAATGLSFLRKHAEQGTLYFVCNETKRPVDQWVSPAATAGAMVLMDPASERIGQPATQTDDAGNSCVRIQLEPGESVFLLAADEQVAVEPWAYHDPAGDAATLSGAWSVEFVEGGPLLPEGFTSEDGPAPWTESPDPAAQAFAGTVCYTHEFDAPAEAGRWRLCLGKVAGSARVTLNGQPVATLLGPGTCVDVGPLKPTGNRLEVEVTGVAANRIRDMDRRGVPWRVFEDINLVTISYKRFDASNWPVFPLGLHGPVTLTPLR